MTADEFRAAALKIKGVVEAAHMNHPDFRVNGRIFASLGYPADDLGMVKLTRDQQRAFMQESPKMFAPCAGAWGKQGATNVHLALANKRILSKALRTAAQNLMNA